MIHRKQRETQLDFVRRMLHERGSVSTREMLYEMAYDNGRATAIYRLGARICDLRREGMVIDMVRGSTTTYNLRWTPYEVVVGEAVAYRRVA